MILSGKKWYITSLIRKVLSDFQSGYLFRNSVYLILATAVMAGFGFFFWLIASRLFTSEQVGIATTLISVTSLITSFSLLGLDNGLIRYLPTSNNKNDKINTAISLVTFTSIIISLFFLIFIKVFTPKLMFIRDSLILSILLIIFTTFYSLNVLFDGIFTASRQTVYVFIKNATFSVIKLILPLILVSWGAYGLFMSFGIASTIAVILSLFILIIKFSYSIRLGINKQMVKIMGKFSAGNYIAMFIGGLPALSLPILITNSIGAKYSAYFFIDMMIANLLFIIPISVSQSLFAEGSYNETEVKVHQKKAINIIALILVPVILLTVFLGKYVLLAFGLQYSIEGYRLLQILAISSIFVSVNSIGDVVLKLRHQINKLITIKLAGTIIILGLSYILHSKGLTGIGVAWIAGYIVTCGIYFIARIVY